MSSKPYTYNLRQCEMDASSSDKNLHKRRSVERSKEANSRKKHLFSDESGPYDGFASERRRKNMQILFNHTSIIPFKWRGKYLCFYCGKFYNEYQDFKKHTKSHGLCTTKDYALKIIKGNHIEIKIDISEITCDICNDSFKSFDVIVDHLIAEHCLEYDKTVDVPFQQYRLSDCQCLHCGLQFAYFGYLITHVNTHHPQNRFICNDCGASFNKKRDLSFHLRNYHKIGGYSCDRCLKIFETNRLLLRHQNNYHFRKCKDCNTSFATYSLLQKHIQTEHPDDDSLKCKFCSKEMHSKQGLKQHLNKCKVKLLAEDPTEDIDDTFDDKIEPQKRQNVNQIRQNIICVLNMSTAIPFRFFAKYSCFFCSKKFLDFEELKDHTITNHPVCDLNGKYMKTCKADRTCIKIDISALNCKICKESITDLDELIDHLINNHDANYDKTLTNCLQPFRIIKDNIPCPYCPQIFRYFTILLRHINSEHSDNKTICDSCGRSFKNVTNLKVHISYAHKGLVECSICFAKFKNQWCLSRHKAKNHDSKEFQCPKCPELFHSQYHKQKHLIKVHNTGHKCTYCGRMFTRNSFMKDHIRRTHLKEKNVPCSVCNEKFFDNYLLRMHMVKHEGDRKFTCNVCGKLFLRRSNLYSHMEMHKKYGHVEAAT